MLNVVSIGGRVDISSSGIDFSITGSLVSGTSFIVADIEAIGYDWEVIHTGTMVNAKLVPREYDGVIAATMESRGFAIPYKFNAPPLMTGTSTQTTSTPHMMGFASMNGYVTWSIAGFSGSIKRQPVGGGTINSVSRNMYYGNFVCMPSERVLIQKQAAGWGNIECEVYDWKSGSGTVISSLPEQYSSGDYRAIDKICITKNSKLVIGSVVEDSSYYPAPSRHIVEVWIYNVNDPTSAPIYWESPGFPTNYQSKARQLVLVDNIVYIIIPFGGLPDNEVIDGVICCSAPIIVKINTDTGNVSYGRLYRGSDNVTMTYSAAYDKGLNKIGVIEYTRDAVGTIRHYGLMLVDLNSFSCTFPYEIEWNTTDPPPQPSGFPKAIVRGSEESWLITLDGNVRPFNSPSTTDTTVNIGVAPNEVYQQPIHVCNVVDKDGHLWTLEGSTIIGHSVIGGDEPSIITSIPSSTNTFLYLCDGKLFVLYDSGTTDTLYLVN